MMKVLLNLLLTKKLSIMEPTPKYEGMVLRDESPTPDAIVNSVGEDEIDYEFKSSVEFVLIQDGEVFWKKVLKEHQILSLKGSRSHIKNGLWNIVKNGQFFQYKVSKIYILKDSSNIGCFGVLMTMVSSNSSIVKHFSVIVNGLSIQLYQEDGLCKIVFETIFSSDYTNVEFVVCPLYKTKNLMEEIYQNYHNKLYALGERDCQTFAKDLIKKITNNNLTINMQSHNLTNFSLMSRSTIYPIKCIQRTKDSHFEEKNSNRILHLI